ncbi:hypothetical protein BOQ60_17160 [Chryseobacterium sp. CH1]|nr:hypothetical protein BOQ60_17160 [Chryseobacterium sp. CH1]
MLFRIKDLFNQFLSKEQSKKGSKNTSASHQHQPATEITNERSTPQRVLPIKSSFLLTRHHLTGVYIDFLFFPVFSFEKMIRSRASAGQENGEA